MTCCGSKRAAWSREQSASSATAPNAQTAATHEKRIFKYVGPGKLVLKGTASGKRYVFERTGAELEVAFEDSSALMSARYLRLKVAP